MFFSGKLGMDHYDSTISPVQLWLFTVFPLIVQIVIHVHASWILKSDPSQFDMYANKAFPSMQYEKLTQRYIWYCLIMVVVWTILKLPLLAPSYQVFFCRTSLCNKTVVNSILCILGSMFFEMTEFFIMQALWLYKWCHPETTAWDKTYNSVEVILIILWDSLSVIRGTLAIAYLIYDAKKSSSGGLEGSEWVVGVFVAAGCVFQFVAAYLSLRMSVLSVKNMYKVLYSSGGELTEYRRMFVEYEFKFSHQADRQREWDRRYGSVESETEMRNRDGGRAVEAETEMRNRDGVTEVDEVSVTPDPVVIPSLVIASLGHCKSRPASFREVSV